MALPRAGILSCLYPAIIYVAAGRGCARAVHAAVIHVAGAHMDAIYSVSAAAENGDDP